VPTVPLGARPSRSTGFASHPVHVRQCQQMFRSRRPRPGRGPAPRGQGMIPHRVRLKGFLCYKDEQAIDFGGNATLWMLSGLNGSGKSAIFDAVTYALFGHHRGGGQHAHELINKDSDSMLVEFDFLLDGKEYRAKRTLKRDTKGGARGTQQMFRWDPGSN